MDYEVAVSHIKLLREDFEKDAVETRPYTGHGYDYHLETEALWVAYDALKKQIPMKPVRITNELFLCPICYETLFSSYKPQFCNICGQALDWRDD